MQSVTSKSSEVARALGMSKPAILRRLENLEDRLGHNSPKVLY